MSRVVAERGEPAAEVPPRGPLAQLVFALPALARLLALAVDLRPYFYVGDSYEYLNILEPVTNKPLAYNIFVRTCCMAFGDHVAAIIFGQTILGVATAYLLYVVCARGLGLDRRVAVGVYLVAGLWPVNILYEHAILSEALFSFLLAALLACVFSVRRGTRAVGLLGVVLGLACITRTVGAVLVPVVGAALLLPDGRLPLGRRLARTLAAALACAAIVVPYAGIFRSLTGTLGITAFRGRTQLPYVAELVDPAAVEDATLREVLLRRRRELLWAPRDRLRWCAAEFSPLREAFERPRPDGLPPLAEGSWLWDCLGEKYVQDVYGPPRRVAAFDRELARISDGAIAAHPLGYLRIVARQLAVLLLDVRATSAAQSLFQSAETAAVDDRARTLRDLLEGEYGYDLPPTGEGALRVLVSRTCGARLALVVGAFAVSAWLAIRRRLGVAEAILVLFAAAVTFAPILAQEYYGRYFVPATNLLLVLLGAGIARLGPGIGMPALVLAAHLGHSVLAPWFGYARGWDYSLTGGWGGGVPRATTYPHGSVGLRDGWGELLVSDDAAEGSTAVLLAGHFHSPGGVWAALYRDPDNDGTPPDDLAERDAAVDLSRGVDALVLSVKGKVDPAAVRILLHDAAGLGTNGGDRAPALGAFLPPEGLRPDAWCRVRIPLAAFPTSDERTEDGSPMGPVDFSRIAAVAFTVTSDGDDQEFSLLIDEVRFEGERTVWWVRDDDTEP